MTNFKKNLALIVIAETQLDGDLKITNNVFSAKIVDNLMFGN